MEDTAVTATLTAADDCGRWSIEVDAHVYLNIEVDDPAATCDGTTSGGVFLPYDPIFSYPADYPAKWTFDIQGRDPGDGALDVACSDGTLWSAIFVVTG